MVPQVSALSTWSAVSHCPEVGPEKCGRLRRDWIERYGHPISAVETFVDRSRFSGTCYRAANWRRVGQTSGRTRNGARDEPLRSVKDVYLYGLTPRFRCELCGERRRVRASDGDDFGVLLAVARQRSGRVE